MITEKDSPKIAVLTHLLLTLTKVRERDARDHSILGHDSAISVSSMTDEVVKQLETIIIQPKV